MRCSSSVPSCAEDQQPRRATWYCGFSTAVALVRARVGEWLLRVVDVGIGCGLIGFGGLLAYRSANDA